MCEAAAAPCGFCTSCRQVDQGGHPDVLWVAPLQDKNQVSIDQVRELIRFAQLTSLTDHYRVVVISNVAELTPEAANALLKVLEEPPKGVIFFLLDPDQGAVLATLSSRCVVLELGLVPQPEIKQGLEDLGATHSKAEELARLASGLPGVAVNALGNEPGLEGRYELARVFLKLLGSQSWVPLQQAIEANVGKGAVESGAGSQNATRILALWLEVARDLLLLKLGLTSSTRYQKLQPELQLVVDQRTVLNLLSVCRDIQRALQKLEANANPRLTLEWLGLNLSRI
jgi:DNA polymerase-3 subunit delta'